MKLKSIFRKNTIIILIVLLQLSFGSSSCTQKFTIPVLPDTQREVNYQPEMFTSQMEWLASQKDSLKIPIVLHVGDVVDDPNDDQYKIASEGYSILDRAKVPYAIAIGNHDRDRGKAAVNENTNHRKTTMFNSYFPVERFTLQKDRFENNNSDNASYTFKAGRLNWLVLTLEFCARQDAVDWANQIIPKYPKHNVIVLTHYHLESDGEIGTHNASCSSVSIQSIYDQLIKQHPNILMVLSGHHGKSVWRDDIGENGNHIYQILQDYQGEDHGGGYIRLLEIDPKAETISAKMYSPFYNQTKNDASIFSFSGVKFIGK
ncbi:metallophosphoesterase [Bacteroidota bacterium]